ncbi:MAG: biopolymer transporter ExbD [Proteobacteria bacterium]|nr:biopolymer transporter ExbD [Desulfobulbaceae bacterium]MBU4151921.1 biopolymer transporter ExbD [Pseudomonadota bacterium]
MDDKGFTSINVIPLVDVMLVLLTIVLTTSTFIAVGAIPVELPKAMNFAVEPLKSITIEIDSKGVVFFEAKPIDIGGLGAALSQLTRETPVLIRADRNVALQSFVEVMDTVKGLGFIKASLQTEKKS